jgi:hypothetical protein
MAPVGGRAESGRKGFGTDREEWFFLETTTASRLIRYWENGQRTKKRKVERKSGLWRIEVQYQGWINDFPLSTFHSRKEGL